MNKVRKLAVFMHNEYEKISKEENWNTQKNCQGSFNDLPAENKRVMLKLSESVIAYLGVIGV